MPNKNQLPIQIHREDPTHYIPRRENQDLNPLMYKEFKWFPKVDEDFKKQQHGGEQYLSAGINNPNDPMRKIYRQPKNQKQNLQE